MGLGTRHVEKWGCVPVDVKGWALVRYKSGAGYSSCLKVGLGTRHV